MTGAGFTQTANVVAQALFANRAARDYRLQSPSPCSGKGPASIQPAVTAPASPDRFVSVSAPTSAATGDELSVAIKVQNRTAVAGPVSVSVSAATAKLLGLSGSAGSCSGTTCTATLGANGSLTITARVGATTAGSATVTAKLGETDATPSDNTATATTTITGPTCTFAGSDAADTVQGSASNEVFCLFGGDDTVMPGAGNDTVLGGSGTDRLSYWNAPNAVVINLGQAAAWDAGAGTGVGWDTFRSVEWGTGSAYSDTLVGTPGPDILDGLEGNDEIWGYAGNDTLKGWVGNDKLYGGDGDDTLDGAEGTDTCDQGAGTGTKSACEA
jgi:Ca2+-binding RTX toxin-like protein